MNKVEVVSKVREALEENCERPSTELRKMGQAMISIADALEGQTIVDARAIMKSVGALLDISEA